MTITPRGIIEHWKKPFMQSVDWDHFHRWKRGDGPAQIAITIFDQTMADLLDTGRALSDAGWNPSEFRVLDVPQNSV